MLLGLYRKMSKLIEGNEKTEYISKVCMCYAVPPFRSHQLCLLQQRIFPVAWVSKHECNTDVSVHTPVVVVVVVVY